MGTKEAVKRNQSSMQVLKTLQLLLEDNYTMAELIEKLNTNEKDSIFNNSVVSKYINTCRYCGIDIPKIHNKYFVANLPFGLDLSPKDLDLLDELQYTVKNTMSKKSDQVFDRFINNLSKYSNKRIMRVEPKTEQMVYELFDTAIAEKRKIKLMFRAKAEIVCIPIGIALKKDKNCFHVMSNGKERFINIDRITGLEIIDEKFERETTPQSVIFKIKPPLAERYSVKECEHVVRKEDDGTVISNEGENKEELFARLLRYDHCCEILYPLHYREEMKNLIDEMLKNYGE